MAILRSSKRTSSALKFSRSTDFARSKVRRSFAFFVSSSRFWINSSICARAPVVLSRSAFAFACRFSIFFASCSFFALYSSISASSVDCLSVWLVLRFCKWTRSSFAVSMSFSSAIICKLNSDARRESSSRASESACRSPVSFSSAASFSANVLPSVSSFSRAVAAFCKMVSARVFKVSFSSINSRTEPETVESCSCASFSSPSRRIFSSFARSRSPCAPSNSARAAAKSSVNIL